MGEPLRFQPRYKTSRTKQALRPPRTSFLNPDDAISIENIDSATAHLSAEWRNDRTLPAPDYLLR